MFGKQSFALIFLIISAVLAGEYTPKQMFLNLGGDDKAEGMTFSWVTEKDAKSTVYWGTKENKLHNEAKGTVETYDYCDTQNEYKSGYIHHVTVPKIKNHNTKIYYRVGDKKHELSDIRSFTTMPKIGDKQPLSLGLVGDLGQTGNSSFTLKHLYEQNPQAVILAGDLSYADGEQAKWDTWGDMMDPYASRVPWMTVPGNHEQEDWYPDNYINATNPGNGTCRNMMGQFKAYQARFKMPKNKDIKEADRSLYYSFDIGQVHFVMINPYIKNDIDSEQYKWLVNDLEHINKKVTPWTIVVTHGPWYNSNGGHPTDIEEQGNQKRATEDLLHQHQIPLVVSGHVHSYERTHRVYKEKRDETGPMYLNIGDGGNHEGLYSDWKEPQPAWSAYRRAKYGFATLDVYNETHLHIKWHQNDENGSTKVLDQVVLAQNN